MIAYFSHLQTVELITNVCEHDLSFRLHKTVYNVLLGCFTQNPLLVHIVGGTNFNVGMLALIRVTGRNPGNLKPFINIVGGTDPIVGMLALIGVTGPIAGSLTRVTGPIAGSLTLTHLQVAAKSLVGNISWRYLALLPVVSTCTYIHDLLEAHDPCIHFSYYKWLVLNLNPFN